MLLATLLGNPKCLWGSLNTLLCQALRDPYFKGLSRVEREPSCQPIKKVEFDFEHKRMSKEEIRELIFRRNWNITRNCWIATWTTQRGQPFSTQGFSFSVFAHVWCFVHACIYSCIPSFQLSHGIWEYSLAMLHSDVEQFSDLEEMWCWIPQDSSRLLPHLEKKGDGLSQKRGPSKVQNLSGDNAFFRCSLELFSLVDRV